MCVSVSVSVWGEKMEDSSVTSVGFKSTDAHLSTASLCRDSIERYDPYQNQWTACRPMSEPRTGECNRTGLYNSDIPSQAELVFNTALLTYLVKTEAEVQILSIRSAAYCLCFRPFSWQFSMLVDRKSTRLKLQSHCIISYAVFCLKKYELLL